MKYLEPTTVEEVLELLAQHGHAAKVIAGGQSLLILLRTRLVDPEVLIGLSGIASLHRMQVNGTARIGAMVTHTTVERDPKIARGWPILAAAEAAVSSLQIRNRGTLCGNIAHAFPAADPPAALIACDARVHLRSKKGGDRDLPAEKFFVGVMETAARPDELVTEVSLPPQPKDARGAYLKYAIRPLDFAIVGVAARIVLARDGTISEARIGLNGVADRSVRATEAEAALIGQRPSAEVLVRAGEIAARHSEPVADIDGSVDYKRRVTAVYTRRALEQALA